MEVHLVSVKVSVVRVAHALVEAKRSPRQRLDLMGHDGKLVQRRLSVEQDNIAVNQMSLHDGPDLEVVCKLVAIPVPAKTTSESRG